MLTIVHTNGLSSQHHLSTDRRLRLGREDFVVNGVYEAHTFISRKGALTLLSLRGKLYMHNTSQNAIRVFNDEDRLVAKMTSGQIKELNSTHRVRMCPCDTAEGVEWTDVWFALSEVEDDPTQPGWAEESEEVEVQVSHHF